MFFMRENEQMSFSITLITCNSVSTRFKIHLKEKGLLKTQNAAGKNEKTTKCKVEIIQNTKV